MLVIAMMTAPSHGVRRSRVNKKISTHICVFCVNPEIILTSTAGSLKFISIRFKQFDLFQKHFV